MQQSFPAFHHTFCRLAADQFLTYERRPTALKRKKPTASREAARLV
jgi:hypothetical protein